MLCFYLSKARPLSAVQCPISGKHLGRIFRNVGWLVSNLLTESRKGAVEGQGAMGGRAGDGVSHSVFRDGVDGL